MKSPFKIFWIVLGFLCLGFGTIGIVLPILPTVPFYMATLFCSLRKVRSGCTAGLLELNYIRSISTASYSIGR